MPCLQKPTLRGRELQDSRFQCCPGLSHSPAFVRSSPRAPHVAAAQASHRPAGQRWANRSPGQGMVSTETSPPPPPPREVRAQVVSGFPSCFSSGCPGPCTALLSTSLLRAALRPDRIHGGSLAFSLSSMPPGPTQVCSAGCDDVGHAAAWHASRLLKLFPCLTGSLGPQPQHSCGSG